MGNWSVQIGVKSRSWCANGSANPDTKQPKSKHSWGVNSSVEIFPPLSGSIAVTLRIPSSSNFYTRFLIYTYDSNRCTQMMAFLHKWEFFWFAQLNSSSGLHKLLKLWTADVHLRKADENAMPWSNSRRRTSPQRKSNLKINKLNRRSNL